MNKIKSTYKLVAFLLCIAGCSQIGTVNQEEQAGSQLTSKTLSNEATIEETSGTSVNSTVLLSNAANGFSLVEELTVNEDKYLIKLASGDPVVNVLKLTNPPRLVVDVLGAKNTGSQEVNTSDVSGVANIRLGNHADKLRVVLDLKSEDALSTQSVESAGGDVLVTIPVSENTKALRLARLSTELSNSTQRAQLSEEDTEDMEENGEESGHSALKDDSELTAALNEQEENEVDAPVDLNVESKLPSQAVTTKNSKSNNLIELSTLDFSKTSNSPGEVTLGLSTPAAFELFQSAQSEYILSLPGVTPSQKVLAPLISIKGEEGIRSVRVVQEGNKTLVRFFVDAGVTLSAIPRDELILVKPASSLAARKSSARGQMAEPEVKVNDKTAQANPTGLRSSDGSKIYTGRLISLDLQDTDIDNALRIIAEVSNLNIIASEDVSGRVTLRLMDVPWDQALDVILKTNGLDQVTEGNVIRIAPVDKLRQEREALREAKVAAENLEDLAVQYVRVSYARAEDVKAKVESVLTERGSVTADERTNQLIIKDIQAGIKDALELLRKLDLRTPQILLETQIVEGSRTILRDLGFQWNFSHIQSPETGNATGVNFPNTVALTGGAADSNQNPWAVNFPSVIGSEAGSAITAILDSADGSRQIAARLSALEQEGKAKIVSKPQVATLNNKQAKISSVTTIRVRTPNAGTTVATGAGSNASGGGAQAFQTFSVGIELDVTPQASPDYYVLLDIDAVSSSFAPREAVDGIPATIERKATSSILVKSNQTFALGGVYRIEDSDAINGVPFLKDIPFIGAAFRQSIIRKSDEELIFFITPHIVEGSFDHTSL